MDATAAMTQQGARALAEEERDAPEVVHTTVDAKQESGDADSKAERVEAAPAQGPGPEEHASETERADVAAKAAEVSAGESSTDAEQSGSEEETAAGGGGAAPPTDGVPSLGSAAHFAGECTPCCFFFKSRCRNGESCQFCHLPHEKRSRGRGCRGHGTTKKERLRPAAAAAPALLPPPPGLDLPDADAAEPVAPRSFLATKPPAGTFHTAPPVAYHQSMLLPEASSRPVAPAMALGLSSPAPGHPAMRLGAAGGAGARRPPAAMLATPPPTPHGLAPPTPGACDGASLPRLLGGARSRAPPGIFGPPLPQKTRDEVAAAAAGPRPAPESSWGPAPVKVAISGLGGAPFKADPTAPMKMRVPDWSV